MLFSGWLLLACQSAPAPTISALHKDMDALFKDPLPLATDSDLRRLETALVYFEQIDEAEGQWRANKAIADWHIKHHQTATALPYASRGLAIAKQLSRPEYIYASAVQVGQLNDSETYFSVALNHAQSDKEKALALTLLQRFDAAESAILSSVDADYGSETAYIYYHIGKYQRNLGYLLKARQHYQYADNTFGVIDSLFLAAQISEAQQDTERARDFAERALRAAKHSESKARISAITKWLSDQSDE